MTGELVGVIVAVLVEVLVVVAIGVVVMTGATVSAPPLHPEATSRNVRRIAYFHMAFSLSLSLDHCKTFCLIGDLR